MEKLFTAKTANDATAANAINATGSELAVHAFGTWDGATLGVYLSNNGTSNGVLLADLTFTSDGWVALQVPPGGSIWAQLSGVGTSSVNCWISGQGTD